VRSIATACQFAMFGKRSENGWISSQLPRTEPSPQPDGYAAIKESANGVATVVGRRPAGRGRAQRVVDSLTESLGSVAIEPDPIAHVDLSVNSSLEAVNVKAARHDSLCQPSGAQMALRDQRVGSHPCGLASIPR
jgi:hypothetical protein